MLTMSRILILLLGLAVLAGVSHADDFMLGGGSAPGGVALAQSRQDCDIQPTAASARVIYHDGQRAPVSVPMDARGSVGDDVASTEGAGDTAPASGAAVTLPSAEAAVPQKPRGGGLRWQSVLPGSIK
jgi:hypothetical protein